MANKPLKTIKFPGLDDTYTVPQVDAALATSGAAADAKAVGDELSNLKQDFSDILESEELSSNNWYVDASTQTLLANASSKTFLLDISRGDITEYITTITGDTNRCRLLFFTQLMKYITVGSTGVMVDLGNTTKKFTIKKSDYNSYKTVAIATNYEYVGSTPPSVNVVLSHGSPSLWERTNKLSQKMILMDDAIIGGIKLYTDELNYEVFNGATIETTTKTITIPSGSTGYNSYMQMSYRFPSYMGGKDISAIIKIYSPNLVIPDTGGWVSVLSPNGTHIDTSCDLVSFSNGLYEFELKATINNPISSYYSVTIQVKNNLALSSSATVQLVDVFLFSEDYTNRVLNENPPIVFQVGADKEYTSIRTALEACKNGNEQNKYVVEWYSNGVEYDTNDDITSADLNNSNFVGLTVPPYTKLIGMNRYSENIITLNLDTSISSSIRNRISTINLQENAEIENLTIIGKNCRYAVHDDTSSYNPSWKEKTIKNCRIVSDGTIQTRAYGAGYRSGQKWVFENCAFELTGSELQSGYAAFTAHNNNGFTKPSFLEFYNCRFIGGGAGAGFGSLNAGDSNVISTIKMVGCNLTASLTDAWEWKCAVLMYDENGNRSGCETAITGYANNFGASDVKFRSNDSIDYSERVTVWGKITD